MLRFVFTALLYIYLLLLLIELLIAALVKIEASFRIGLNNKSLSLINVKVSCAEKKKKQSA